MNTCSNNAISEEYLDFIIPNNDYVLQEINSIVTDTCIEHVDSQFSIIHTPHTYESVISSLSYTNIPSLYALMDDISSMTAAGITATFSQPYLNLRGQGVMIGFIDTGIDYRNPLFRNPDGSTRVVGIWDQTIPTPNRAADTPPELNKPNTIERLLYGTEYTQAQINDALNSPSPLEIVPSMDENGHGTFMAGVAAGSESSAMKFIGAAPNCVIGVVKLKPAKQYLRNFFCIKESAVAYQENDIMMGIKYLELLSFRYDAPLVIYLGVGTNHGSHEGTSPLSLVLTRASRIYGNVCVLPAGNETGLRHHYLGLLTKTQEYDDVEIRVGASERSFAVELWASAPEIYTIGFVSPTGQVIQKLPPTTQFTTTIDFTLEATQITVIYQASDFNSGSESIFIRFVNPTPGIWRIRVYNSLFITGTFHMWLPVDGFISEETYFLNSNPYTTITEPGNTHVPITVGTYNHQNNSLYIHSSRGYTRDNIVKPELVAPGVNVYGPGLAPRVSDPVFPLVQKSGSSVAAAHVAGAVANLLTWGLIYKNDMTMTTTSIKTYLIRGASRNPSYTYPNRDWGFGSLNLYASLLRIRN